MNPNRWLIVVWSMLCAAVAVAQRECTVKGTYIYQIPSSMSYDEACHYALLKAQHEALADKFGTYMVQDGTMITENKNGKSDQQLISISQSQVMGEWLGDTDEPRYERIMQDGYDCVRVTVKGKAREIVNAGVDFDVKPLRSSLDLRHASTEFRADDDLYLYFRTPQDGYICVYLLDYAQMEAYCLLPYQDDGGGAYKVEHDCDYYFFSKAKSRRGEPVTELQMTISPGHKMEINDLYVIFSPNSFSKANSTTDERRLNDELIVPRSMSFKNFNSWLVKYRAKDREMRSQRISLKISPTD